MGHDAFRAGVETQDLGAMVDALSPDVVFHSPITFKPFEGKEAVSTLLGVVMANGFSFVMHATSSPEFCANACHYMRDFVAPEVANSVHGRNASGVAATCPDCHVPQPFLAKAMRKIEATREGWGHLRGIIDTRDKFEAHRLRMAERVWAGMKATDSRECRSCHNFNTMEF